MMIAKATFGEASGKFEDVDFRGKDLRDQNFYNHDFIRCNLDGCDLTGCWLEDSGFSECSLEGTKIEVTPWGPNPGFHRCKGKWVNAYEPKS